MKQNNLNRPIQKLKPFFDYYRDREERIVRLAYKLGATVHDVASAIGIDPGLVSRNYPKFPKKNPIAENNEV